MLNGSLNYDPVITVMPDAQVFLIIKIEHLIELKLYTIDFSICEPCTS